jgi:hypothetical protein
MTEQIPDTADIAQRLKSILDYVQDCERRVHMGEIMDLSGLDARVIDICNDIAAVPPQDARQLETKMSVLIENLDLLAASMRKQQEKYAATGAR